MLVEYGIPPGESLTIQQLVEKLESSGEGTRFFVINDRADHDGQVKHMSEAEGMLLPLPGNNKLQAVQ